MIPFLAGFALGVVATAAGLVFLAVGMAMLMDDEARK